MPTDSTSRIVRFGVFEVDLEAGELRRKGMKVKLQEQPFQVLAALLEHPGRVVTREDLRSKLWPADTFVDFDHSLNAAIKRLRDALGESADAPMFIETLARRGYRFIGPIDDSSVPSGIAVGTVQERGKTLLWRRRIISLLLLLALAVLGWIAWKIPSRPKDVVELKLTANSPENSVGSAAISPEGRYLAYRDNRGIYIKLISTGETHSIPLPPGFTVHVNDWFRDGSHLLVSRDTQPDQHSLWSISIFGGSPRQLTNDGWGGKLSPDGSHIAFQRRGTDWEEWVMRSDGTEQIKVAANKSAWLGSPRWSPDGNRIAYVSMMETYNARESSVHVNEWRNLHAQTLFSDNRLGPSLYWLPNGYLICTLTDAENQQGASLWMVPPQQSGRVPGTAKRITRGIGWINWITGSDDARIVTFLRENTFSSIYIARLAPDGTHFLDSRRLTLDENQNVPSAWTADSKTILFHSKRNGTSQIFKQSIDQPLAESVINSTDQLQQPRLTPDGSEILYISTPKTADLNSMSSVIAVPMSGGPPRVIVRDTNIWNVQCARSPSTLCMYSITKGETSETYRFDIATGKNSDPPQVDPPCNWSLSPDGSQRAIVPDGSKGIIRLRSTLSGQTHDLAVKGWDTLNSIDWSVEGKSLLVSWEHESDTALLRVALDGKVSVLLRAKDLQVIGPIQSPDGRVLAFAGISSTRNAWQIENFR